MEEKERERVSPIRKRVQKRNGVGWFGRGELEFLKGIDSEMRKLQPKKISERNPPLEPTTSSSPATTQA